MKRIAFGAALAVLAGPAFAADPVVYEPAPAAVPVAAVYDWSGFYVGLQGGYSWADTGYYLDIPPDTTSGQEFELKGGVFGAHVGYNWQWGSFVLGAEGDFEWSGLEGDDGDAGGTTDVLEANYQGSVRARLGYAFDRLLIYGTAGWTWMNVDYSRPDFDPEVLSATLDGPTVGIGAEYAFMSNWTARAEYRWARFDEHGFPFVAGDQRTTRKFDTHTVRLGVSYKF